MLKLVAKYKYMIAYITSLLVALFVIKGDFVYIAPSADEGFSMYMVKFFIAIFFVIIAIYFYAKDSARKRK